LSLALSVDHLVIISVCQKSCYVNHHSVDLCVCVCVCDYTHIVIDIISHIVSIY